MYTNKIKFLMGDYFKWYRIVLNKTIQQVSESIKHNYRTYKDIEEGKTKKFDGYYDELQQYFKIKFYDNYDLFECIINESPTFYKMIENYDYENIGKYLNCYKNKLSSLKKFAYYKELYSTLELIEKNYIKKEFISLNEINQAIHLIKLWNNSYSSILVEICEKANVNKYYDNKISNLLYKTIVPKDSISKYWYARECKMHMNYMQALENFTSLVEYFEEKNNYERCVLVKLKIFDIYRDMDLRKADEYICELIKISTKDISNILKQDINYAIAIYYYFQRKYENALNFFKLSYEYGPRDACLIFIYTCESRLNQLVKINHQFNSKYPLFPYITYFEMKADKAESIILENYIFNSIMPLLKNDKYKEPFWSMFEYELNELVEYTRNYKKLKIFYKNMQTLY